jgi:hypothetical protein
MPHPTPGLFHHVAKAMIKKSINRSAYDEICDLKDGYPKAFVLLTNWVEGKVLDTIELSNSLKKMGFTKLSARIDAVNDLLSIFAGDLRR